MSTKNLQILDSLIPSYDENLSETSTNAVQNKAVASVVNKLDARLYNKSDAAFQSIAFRNNDGTSTIASGPTDDSEKDSDIGVSAVVTNDIFKFIAGNELINFSKAYYNYPASSSDKGYAQVVVTVNADPKGAADDALADAKTYTDTVASGKSDTTHTHDDRYYTEAEIDSKVSTLNSAISGKANSSHTHSISDVTNLQSSLDAKAPAYTYGTTDLTAGSSSLATGKLYIVYE